jgi:hypothetical protein
MWGRHRVRAVTAAVAVALAAGGTGLGASTASGAPAELTGPPRQVYADGGESYLVDTGRGTVQWLDRETMAPRGAPVELGGPIGRPVVDPAGVLWATVGRSGSVTAVFRDKRARPIKVSGEGRPLQLTLVTGRLVAFDRRTLLFYAVDQAGVRLINTNFRDPKVSGAHDDTTTVDLMVPPRTESSLLPVLGRSRLIVMDLDLNRVWSMKVTVEGDNLAEPQAYGRSVILTYGNDGFSQRLDFSVTGQVTLVEGRRELAGSRGYRTILVRNGTLFLDEVHNPKPR